MFTVSKLEGEGSITCNAAGEEWEDGVGCEGGVVDPETLANNYVGGVADE